MADKFDYSKTLTLVQKLLYKFGTTQTVTRSFSSSTWTRSYNPVTEVFTWTNTSTGATQTTEPSDVTETADGVLVRIGENLLKNTLVKQSDSMLIIVDISEPQVGDLFTVNGKTYEYITHTSVSPANINVLYKIALRI